MITKSVKSLNTLTKRKKLAAALEEVRAGTKLEELAGRFTESVDMLDKTGEVVPVMGILLSRHRICGWTYWLSPEGRLISRRPGCFAIFAEPECVYDFDLEEVADEIQSLIQPL